jgi:hypothetical protein
VNVRLSPIRSRKALFSHEFNPTIGAQVGNRSGAVSLIG